MRSNKVVGSVYLIDSLVVLLNIATGGSLLLFILLPLKKATWVYALTIMIDIVYLCVRKRGPFFKEYMKIPGVLVINILLTYNFFNTTFQGDGDFVSILEYFLLSILFTLVLSTISSNIRTENSEVKEATLYIAKGYIWLSMLSIVGVLITFVLLNLGFDYQIPLEANLLNDNQSSGSIYQWSILSTRIYQIAVRVPFFQDYGMLTGLFHEPHILAYNIFPCLILLLGLVKKYTHTVLLLSTGTLFVLFCGSATNVVSLLVCLSVFLLFSFRNHFILVSIGVWIIITGILAYFRYDDTFMIFLTGRMNTNNLSYEASQNLLTYAFTPETFWGTNIFSSSMMWEKAKNEDVGYISFILNILFLFFYIKNVIVLLLSKDPLKKAIGYSSLYFLLHSFKMGMLMYKSSLPLLLVFLQFIILNKYGRISTSGKNIQKRTQSSSRG